MLTQRGEDAKVVRPPPGGRQSRDQAMVAVLIRSNIQYWPFGWWMGAERDF